MPNHVMSSPIISDHVMSQAGLLQQVLNPMLNPVSRDKRGAFGPFASGTQEPHQAESATIVQKCQS